MEVKFEYKVHGITEDTADKGDVDTTLGMWPVERGKGKLININRESGHEEKVEDIPEEVALAKKKKFPKNSLRYLMI